MKINRIITGVAVCGALLAALSGCKGEYDTDFKRVYFDQAATSSVSKIAIESNIETKATITVRLVKPQSSPVKVTLSLDQGVLDAHNKKFGTSLEMLPAEHLEMETELVIEAGKTQVIASVVIKPFANTGVSYAIPLRITDVVGPVSPSVESSKLLLVLDQPIVQWVPEMDYNSHPKSASIGDDTQNWGETVSDWSLECWVWMSHYNNNNQAIFNFKASTEIYIRFGDTPIKNDQLQIKYMGTQNNTAYHFIPMQWNHIAFVYNGTSGNLTLYVNGKADFTQATNGGPVSFNGMEMISSSGDYFKAKCRMAQIRLWKKSLSETELNSNMFSVTKADDPNLMGYWKMDDGAGRVMKNCATAPTSNRDLTASADNIKWIPDTRFDGK